MLTKADNALAGVSAADEERFWSHVDRSGDCWLWMGCRLPRGYGKFGVCGATVTAHRLALTLKLGRPPRHQAIHSCDNPPCCNPDHLRDGTQVENMADAEERGRRMPPPHRPGEVNGNARLTEADVRAVRERAAAGERYVDLARAFAMTGPNVAHIVSRRAWKHVA